MTPNAPKRYSVVGATVRGATHVAKSRPNEDAFELRQRDGLTVIAVADGHGSARCPRSDVGSAIAARAAVDLMSDALTSDVKGHGDVAEWLRSHVGSSVVDSWRRGVDAHLVAHPFTEQELELIGDQPDAYAYGSTILVAGCTDDVGFALQLGDGHVVLVNADGSGQLAFPEEPKMSTETFSLCTDDAEHFIRARVWPLDEHRPRIVALSTDGWGDAFEDDEWFDRVAHQLTDQAAMGGIERIDDQLEGWLARTATEFGDDATMALLIEDDRMSPPLVDQETPGISTDAVSHAPTWPRLALAVGAALIAGAALGWLANDNPVTASTLWTSQGLLIVDGDRAFLSDATETGGSGPDTVLIDDVTWQLVDNTLQRISNDLRGFTVDLSQYGAGWGSIARDGDRLIIADQEAKTVVIISASSCVRADSCELQTIEVEQRSEAPDGSLPSDLKVDSTPDTTSALDE